MYARSWNNKAKTRESNSVMIFEAINKDGQFYLITNSPTDVGRERTDVASPQVVLLPLVAKDLQLSFLLLIQNIAITDLRNRLPS